MRKGFPRTVRGGAAAVVVCAGGVAVLACNSVLGIGDFTTEDHCQTGNVDCVANAPQLCDEDKQWTTMPACTHQTCENGACVGDCAPEEKRCAGTTPQGCNKSGQWENRDPCDPDKHCSGGACVVECTPGDQRCFGDQPQTCNDDGKWENLLAACKPCFGCDPSIARCATVPKADGAPCTDTNKCALTADCQNGECVMSTSIKCIDAGVCSPGTCDRNTGTCAAPDGTPCDDGDVCTTSSSTCQAGLCASAPSSDRSWAHWDLAAPPPPSRYTCPSDPCTTTDGVVFDHMTRLMWQRGVPAGAYSWDNAKKYCDSLNGSDVSSIACNSDKVPGYSSGWRLPTRIELASIVDYGSSNPAIDAAAFPATPGAGFWSSSSDANVQGYAWYVSFYDGSAYGVAVDNAYRVRCVR